MYGNPLEPDRPPDGTYIGVYPARHTSIHVNWHLPEGHAVPHLPAIPEPPANPPDYWFTDTMPTKPTRERGGPWYLLLFVPVALSLATPLYNRLDPRLFGMPFFYWGQLTFVVLSITVVTLVYHVTKVRRR
ncbi:MAG TPA: DUF3311 domain-containing protein [Pilimelia sp.]|nr:DUF3311 domain-containing protein [Pilimelia sp.]